MNTADMSSHDTYLIYGDQKRALSVMMCASLAGFEAQWALVYAVQFDIIVLKVAALGFVDVSHIQPEQLSGFPIAANYLKADVSAMDVVLLEVLLTFPKLRSTVTRPQPKPHVHRCITIRTGQTRIPKVPQLQGTHGAALYDGEGG